MIRAGQRSLLAAVALAPLGGGCLASSADEHRTEGRDDESIDADLEALMLDADELPGDDWVCNREGTDEIELSREIVRGEETIRLSVSRYDSVDVAETALQASKDHTKEDNSELEAHEIGSSGFFQRTPFTACRFVTRTFAAM
jgi:hypothetical protein